MLPTMFDSTSIPMLQEAVNFAEARHHILAGNIANLDTPGYRVRDLSLETFQARLKEALETEKTRKQPASPGLIGNHAGADDAMRQVRESLKGILFHDDSNVSIEQQVAEISKNQFLHNLAVSIMNSQFRLLQAAVSEKV
jgi:flagellar basal-body rod protein FlgB